MERDLDLEGFDPDSIITPALAFRIRAAQSYNEKPIHTHRKGQLILALHGGITSEVTNSMWMVPPQYAVWVPGQMPHSNKVTADARLCFLFIEPGAVAMPEQCCALKISPLVREIILRLSNVPHEHLGCAATQRLVQVLFDELPNQPVEQLQLPISSHPKIRAMADEMAKNLQQRRTLAQWADEMAMSERNLSRLVVKETGLSFLRWRQQMQLIIALRLLINGQTVQNAAESLGYDSTTAFITMFKKALGTTPGRYLSTLAGDDFTD
ncbi:helix-turn-helix transcriptional regulator [Cedecea davisae]|uniref:Helix-turn-helix transcriptional regulator n=1 Tax=Cedecea davisae TaxID=158484 RepID=A0ABS6DI47_9ENTR|nr:helix-turn-helix transcriptional regulator [Cedecea davisae]MBU4682516.1 helix-turn-helix transcriptional regulator [Cedecea davisae]MBU4688050.1 helix-turn-helix transcriptional regulator [Cedecea davisae]